MQGFDQHHHELALSILARTNELSLATIREDGAPHASTVNFANDGLLLYAAISIDSVKAHDIHLHPHVALTVNAPYLDWHQIQGLSINATASMVNEPVETARASALLLEKFPQFSEVIQDTTVLPWPGMLFIRITPQVVNVIDYTKHFGNQRSFEVDVAAVV
jgi:nitroimidazol reductase NimA-like FMN-containing flavoprotein (pyridoxamine 5'-phosphate oxidase superfamily)